MTFSSATVKYKPIRVGFLVRFGKTEDIIESVKISSLLWGGVYNPIIPVSDGDNNLAKHLIDLFEVDILYTVNSDGNIEAFKQKYSYLRIPSHYTDDIIYEDWDTKKKVVALLDVINPINLFWDKKFRHEPKKFRSNFLLPRWEDGDDLNNVLTLQFGTYPDMNEFKSDYAKAFINGLKAKELEIKTESEIDIDISKNWTPLDLTKVELKGYGGGLRTDSSGLYLGKAKDFTDLVNFWNIRASGIDVIFVSIDHIERQQKSIQSFVDKLNTRPSKRPDIPRLISLYGIEPETNLVKLQKVIKSEMQFLLHNVSEFSLNGYNLKPSYQVFKYQSTSTQIEPAYGKYVVNVKLPPKNFLYEEDDDMDSSRQNLAVIISPYNGEHTHPGYTFDIPYITELTEFYSRKISISPWDLRVNRENFTILIETKNYEVSLYPIEINTLIHKIFENSGIAATTSQPGRIAQRLISKMEGIDGGRFLKIKGVRMLLNQGDIQSMITKSEATRTIFENDFTKHERLFIEPRKESRLTADSVFQYLLKNEYFRAGLDLICDDCKLHSWLSLREVNDKWECEYCGTSNLTSIQLKNRGDWKFRKSGLFAKNNNQEGSIPVILTLMTINRVLSHDDFIYTTALELKGDGFSCETDFCILEQNRYNSFSICIGEAKSDGGEITKEDCGNLKKVADIITQKYSGSRVFIAMTKTSDRFSEAEIKNFKALHNDYELILFTRKELETYHPYWKEDGGIDNDIPQKYPNSLADLAHNSHSRYLS